MTTTLKIAAVVMLVLLRATASSWFHSRRNVMKLRILSLIAACSFFAIPAAHSQPANSAWPTFQHDFQHTGRSNFAGPQDARLAWTYTVSAGTISAPALGPQGTIYFGSPDNNFYAVHPDGSLQWQFTANDNAGVASIGRDSTIYFCSSAGSLFALSENGALKWRYDTGYRIAGSAPALDSTGVIYFGSDEKKVYALNADGSLKWRLDILGKARGSPALGADGTIYLSTEGSSKVYALDPNSTIKWKFDVPTGFSTLLITSPALASDGTIYVGAGWPIHKLYAFTPAGAIKWQYNLTSTSPFDEITGAPAVGSDGTLYFGHEDNFLYAVDANGTFKWKFETGDDVLGSPVIDAQGTILFGSKDDKLYALNSNGTVKWSYTSTDNADASALAINSEGTLYLSASNRLKALFEVASGVPDLAVTAADISFDPDSQIVRGLPVNITATVREVSGAASVKFDITFYYGDKTHPLGTASRFLLPNGQTSAQVTWNTQGLAAGTYPIIVEITNSLPAEANLSNNEAHAGYTLLPNLQDRIDAAVVGDTVWVDPGTYYGLITLRIGVVVKSRMGPLVTILDGQQRGTVVSAANLDNTAVLEGFTIINGNGQSTFGGGIRIDRGGTVIRNNIIRNNTAAWGGGISILGSLFSADPIIERNVITLNEATWGDAMYANNSWALVSNNTIVSNGGGNGDGINAVGFYIPSPRINNCIVWDNGADLSETAEASYACIKNGALGMGSFSADPLFIDAANGDYRLQFGSPCIDAGDPAWRDLDHTRSDVGAFHFDQSHLRGVLMGRITDVGNDRPLPNARVLLAGIENDLLLSDANGDFIFAPLPASNHALSVYLPSYAPGRQEQINVAIGATTVMNFVLTQQVAPPVLLPPANLTAQEQNSNVRLNWQAPSEVLALDDGTFEEAVGFQGGPGILANGPFVPSVYPFKMESLQAAFTGERASDAFRIFVYTDPSGTATKPAAGLLRDSSVVATIAPSGGFQTVDLSLLNLTVTSGNFFIGIKQLEATPMWLALDENAADGKAFYDSNLDGVFTPLTAAGLHGVFGIRVVGSKPVTSATILSRPPSFNKKADSNFASSTLEPGNALVSKKWAGFTGSITAAAPASFVAAVPSNYKIYRAQSSPVQITPSNLIVSVAASVKLYDDFAAQRGKAYFYALTAEYPQGESAPSNETSIELECLGNGDLNNDGALTPGDALCAFQIYLNDGNLPTSCDATNSVCEAVAADVNCDGSATPGDALAIFTRYLQNLPPQECFGRTALSKPQTQAYRLTLQQEQFAEDKIKVALRVENPSGLQAFGFQLEYPAEQLEFMGFARTRVTREWMQLDAQLASSGVLTIGGYHTQPISEISAAGLFEILFAIKSAAAGAPSFSMSHLADDLSSALLVGAADGLRMLSGMPTQFALHQNYPNPFSAKQNTMLRFDLPGEEAVPVELSIFNLNGQLVQQLLSGTRAPGRYEIAWNGKNEAGHETPAGIYWYRLRAGKWSAQKRLVRIR